MKSFAALVVFASLAAQASAAFMVNTPASVVQCQPVLLTWQEGTAPYYPTIIPGGQPSGAALKSFDQTSSTQLTWNVDIPAGSSITVAVRDSTGEQVFSDKVTITGSPTSSCTNASGSASTSSGTETSTDASVAGSSTGSASRGATSGAPSASSQGSGSSTSVPVASTARPSSVASRIATASSSSARASGSAGVSAATNGAAVRGTSMRAAGVAGVLGMIGAALL